MMINITTTSSEETERVGELVAKEAFPGAVIVLEGQLGAGKTTLTKGIARGLSIQKVIKSPTYTFIREYQGQTLPLYHMDMYRLEESGSSELGLEEYLYGSGLSVIEWAQFIADELPLEYIEITLLQLENDPLQRMIRIKATGSCYEQWLKRTVGHIRQLNEQVAKTIEVYDE